MLWYVLALIVVAASLTGLGLALLATYHHGRQALRVVGGATERLREASEGLTAGLEKMQELRAGGPAPTREPKPLTGDGAALADRVAAGRGRR